MTRSLLADAFAHHVWATLTLIDACQALEPAQLATDAAGTFGSILGTMRHLVEADASYLFVQSGGRVSPVDAATMGLPELRAIMAAHGEAWAEVLAADPDPDKVLWRHRDDGSKLGAPFGIRLAQALHHGSDHRSQICTALTTLGVTPPEIDVWDFGWQDGRVVEEPAGG